MPRIATHPPANSVSDVGRRCASRAARDPLCVVSSEVGTDVGADVGASGHCLPPLWLPHARELYLVEGPGRRIANRVGY